MGQYGYFTYKLETYSEADRETLLAKEQEIAAALVKCGTYESNTSFVDISIKEVIDSEVYDCKAYPVTLYFEYENQYATYVPGETSHSWYDPDIPAYYEGLDDQDDIDRMVTDVLREVLGRDFDIEAIVDPDESHLKTGEEMLEEDAEEEYLHGYRD